MLIVYLWFQNANLTYTYTQVIVIYISEAHFRWANGARHHRDIWRELHRQNPTRSSVGIILSNSEEKRSSVE